LIVIICANTGNTATTAPTDNNPDGRGTYGTARVNSKKVSSADTLLMFIRDYPIMNTTSTIFSHAPGTSSGGGLTVLKVTGMSRAGSNAEAQTGAVQQNNAGGSAPAPVFGGAVNTNNVVIAAAFNAANVATLSPRSSPLYSEHVDTGYNNPTTGVEVMSVNSGETSATITWGSSSASAFCAAAIELDTSVPLMPQCCT
jgi:hypothetical protein